ncbi:MAG: MFS transporter [Akkermansiaceae bacterium]|nr:MFS transporter [Armatimonadota bacterium]
MNSMFRIDTPLLREAPLLFAIFLDLIGFGMVIPDVQTRLEAFGAPGWQIGLVLSSYFLFQIIASPLWGRYSDRIGRKPVLVICGILSAASLLAYAFADTVPFILASRILAGLAAANVVAAQAYLADANRDEGQRTAAMGRVGAAITAGLMLGPALGGYLSDLGGNYLLGLVAATASGLGALWIALVVPHVPPVVPLASVSRTASPFVGVSLLRDVPRLRPLLILASVAFLALACLEGTFGRLIRLKLGLGPREFGFIFGYESLLGVLGQLFLLGWITTRLRPEPKTLLGFAFVLQAIGLSLTPFAPSLFALFAISTIYAIGAALTNPTINGLCSAATPKERQGEMFGLLQGARSAGFLLGPTFGGILFDWRPESPYLVAGGILLVSAALLFVVGSRKET